MFLSCSIYTNTEIHLEMNKTIFSAFILINTLFLTIPLTTQAQFLETFDIPLETEWITFTGDGQAESTLELMDSFMRFTVDATNDRQNVWWAIMQTSSTGMLNLEKASNPEYELRIEARVRSSHAPRRHNMQIRTQRSTNNYSQLMEFDIPEAGQWFTVSLTTNDLDIRPGDTITAHIALMDWGPFVYELDVDYVKVDVVKLSEAEPDLGEQVIYPPPVPLPNEFEHSVPAAETGMVDRAWPGVNFSGWLAGVEPVLTIDNTKIILLRWDLTSFTGLHADGYGMLELTPFSFYKTTGTDEIEFDQIRLVEILKGDENWARDKVTLENFLAGDEIEAVLNTQMIIDIDIPSVKDEPRHIHIPRPVIQRMLNGETKGIALYPLGALHASFYPGDSPADPRWPALYFNVHE